MRSSSLLILISLFSFTILIGQNEKAMKHHLAGEMALNSGAYDEALTNFNAAIKNDPSSTWSYIYRGMAYEGIENYEQAVNDFSKALELSPDLTIVYEYRGIAYSFYDFDKAILDFGQSIKYKIQSKFGCSLEQ